MCHFPGQKYYTYSYELANFERNYRNLCTSSAPLLLRTQLETLHIVAIMMLLMDHLIHGSIFACSCHRNSMPLQFPAVGKKVSYSEIMSHWSIHFYRHSQRTEKWPSAIRLSIAPALLEVSLPLLRTRPVVSKPLLVLCEKHF